MRTKMWRAGTLSMVSLSLGCPNEVDKPPPPDVRELVASYANPTAPLNDQTIVAVQAQLQSTLEALSGFCGWSEQVVDNLCRLPASCTACLGLNPITETLVALGDAGAGSEEFDEKTSKLNGFARVTRICRGWGDTKTDDKAENGYIEFTMGFTNAGADPAFGGVITNCKTVIDDTPVTINGALDFAFRRSFAPREILNPDLEPIVRVLGTIDKGNGQEVGFAGSLQLSPAGGVGQTAFSFDVADAGTMLLLVGPRETGLAASNGTFGCDVSDSMELSCENVATGDRVP